MRIDEEESSQNENIVQKKRYGSVRPASSISGPWRCIDSKTSRVGEFSKQVDWCCNPGDLKGKWPKWCGVINRLVDPRVQDFELEEETSTRAVVHFESSRGIVQRLRGEDGQDRTQVFSRGYKACLYWDTAKVFE